MFMTHILAWLQRLLVFFGRGRSARGASAVAFAGLALAVSGCAASRGGPIAYNQPELGRPDAPRPVLDVANYRIATGDLLAINVFQVEALSKDYRVDLAGNIAVPLIGDVVVIGRNTNEISTEIATRLGARYLRNPNVTVSVKESVNNNFTVEGGVERSGIFPITGPTTLLQAIAASGGVNSQRGNPRRIAIFRQIQGQRMAAAFDLVSIRQGEMADPAIYAGDIVVVASNSQRGLLQDLLQTLPVVALFRPF